MQQFKYTGLDVFCHWSVAVGKRLGAMLLLPCMRAVIACVVSGVLLCLKTPTHSAAKKNGFMHSFCKSNAYIKCGDSLDLRFERREVPEGKFREHVHTLCE